jgi:hypothetical protein
MILYFLFSFLESIMANHIFFLLVFLPAGLCQAPGFGGGRFKGGFGGGPPGFGGGGRFGGGASTGGFVPANFPACAVRILLTLFDTY